jgi:cell division protein FtsI (penicillin-binding protein 3)
LNIKQSILLRVRLSFLMVAAVATAIVARMVYLQFVEGNYWRQKAEHRDVRLQPIPALRGNILADDQRLLATSLPFYKIAFDPMAPDDATFKAGIDSLAWYAASFFQDRSSQQYKQLFVNARKQGRRYLPLGDKAVDHSAMQQIITWPIFRKGRLRGGIIFEQETRRFNPFHSLARRTIGYVNNEGRGIVGIELSFDKYLRGKPGQAVYRRSAGNQWVPFHDGSYIEPQDGMDVYTTLDINIQDVAHHALLKALIENDADFGCVVVMEVATGAIKAMVNLGRIDSAHYAEDYNYAIGSKGSTDPGSVFKLASVMALFEDNPQLSLDALVETGNGQYRFWDVVLRDPKPSGYGTITLQQAFEYSSSIGIARLVYEHFKANPQRFINYLHQFGLSTPLDFQLVGEVKPYIKNTNDPTWSRLSLPWIAIGYETVVSPLQLLVFYNAVANNGKMIQPFIVDEIRDKDGRLVVDYEPVVLREQICSPQTLDKARRLLEGVVERGTAQNIKSNQYKIAGKTSTSQKFKNGQYIKEYHTAFAGYFPADKPKYSCIVVIDNPRRNLQYGGEVSAPVFRKIADEIYSMDLSLHSDKVITRHRVKNKQIPYNEIGRAGDLWRIFDELGIPQKKMEGVDEHSWVFSSTASDSTVIWKPLLLDDDNMPDVRGMSLRDALFILENKGLNVWVKGKGKVVNQSIEPGRAIQRGQSVTLHLEHP